MLARPLIGSITSNDDGKDMPSSIGDSIVNSDDARDGYQDRRGVGEGMCLMGKGHR